MLGMQRTHHTTSEPLVSSILLSGNVLVELILRGSVHFGSVAKSGDYSPQRLAQKKIKTLTVDAKLVG